MGPRRLHGVAAVAEAITWTLLITGMVLKYVTRTTELGVSIGGGLHGFVFLVYLALTLAVAVDGRWRAGTVLLGVASAVLPFATLVFDRWARRRGAMAERWRLMSTPAQTPVERLLALVLRRPLPAAVVTLVVVGAVFAGLIRLGPPTQWFG